MPDFTRASAMLLIMSSLTLQPNLFQEFQPMGGVSARPVEGELGCCAERVATIKRLKTMAITERIVFMQGFYQKCPDICIRRTPSLRAPLRLSIYNPPVAESRFLKSPFQEDSCARASTYR